MAISLDLLPSSYPNSIFCLFLMFVSDFAFSQQDLRFLDHGRPVKSYSLKELKKLYKTTERRIFEPHMKTYRVYKGFDVSHLLSKVYGNRWESEEEILFTCRDGYQSSVPVEEFKSYKAYLTFGRGGRKQKFIINNILQGEKQIELGPFYLVWDNIKDSVLKSEAPSYWPYQVVQLDLIRFADRFPKLAPPPNSGVDVKKGFSRFRKHCMNCHSIAGEGGKKGPDLAGVKKRHGTQWLLEFISDPRSKNPKSKMAQLGLSLKGRKEIIENIVKYLNLK